MRNSLLLFALLFCITSCKQEVVKDTKDAKGTEVTEVASLNYAELKPLLHVQDDKIYVVNFWATWCAPCVKELPYFERINKEYKDKNVEVLLVSLDFPKKVTSKLIPFINKKNVESKVVLLDDKNEQFWIGDISEKWSGALPATLIYNKDKREFFAEPITYEILKNTIQSLLK